MTLCACHADALVLVSRNLFLLEKVCFIVVLF